MKWFYTCCTQVTLWAHFKLYTPPLGCLTSARVASRSSPFEMSLEWVKYGNHRVHRARIEEWKPRILYETSQAEDVHRCISVTGCSDQVRIYEMHFLLLQAFWVLLFWGFLRAKLRERSGLWARKADVSEWSVLLVRLDLKLNQPLRTQW